MSDSVDGGATNPLGDAHDVPAHEVKAEHFVQYDSGLAAASYIDNNGQRIYVNIPPKPTTTSQGADDE
jgi:hypothetical protein